MPKHDEDVGDIDEKNIRGQLELVCIDIDSKQRPIKKHIYSLKKHTFCLQAHHSGAYRIIVNKIKEQLVSRKKIHPRVA
jgi:hypothetical protein